MCSLAVGVMSTQTDVIIIGAGSAGLSAAKELTKQQSARAFVGVGTLLFDARFEMQGIAVKRSD